MRIRRDHQVTAGVGIQIEEYEIAFAAMEDKVLGVAVFLRFNAKYAGRRGLSGTDVSVPPRAPKTVHRLAGIRNARRSGWGYVGILFRFRRVDQVLQFLT